MKAPKHRFRIISATGSVFGSATTLGAAGKKRDKMLVNVAFPNILHIQQWSVSCGSWQRPDQCQ